MVSIMEIMQLCRLCLVKEQVNIHIFEEQGDSKQLCSKITSCLPVKVSKEDKLPKKICDGCLYKLELLYQFYNTTVNAEKQLLEWIEQTNMDVNDKSGNLGTPPPQPQATVKEEKLEPVESTNENPDMSADAQNYMLQPEQMPYQPDFTIKESQSSNVDTVTAAENSDEPIAKRPRLRRQATKPIPPESLDSSDNDDDNDAGDSMMEMTVTKTEEESESDGEENVDDPEPTKFEAVGEDTEQPGPSGLGKGGADGPHESSDNEDEFIPKRSSCVSTSDNRSGAPSPMVSITSLNSDSNGNQNLLETILKRIERIVGVQEQHTLVLDNILNINQSTSLQALRRPTDTPMLPINSKADFKNFEEFLQNEEKYNYMKCRLACIGGANVRNAAMNMLKFIITDEVAMNFNWVGRGNNHKRAFKDTHMSRVIKEAIMTAHGKVNNKPPDLNDLTIENAIKDWLKLAKSRFNSKKN